MSPNIKNGIVFAGIVVVLILAYVFFFGGNKEEEDSLVSTSPGATATGGGSNAGLSIAQDFLSLLLNVKSIRLDDSILSDPAFLSLRDSSIVLVPDGTEGRPNPFAPIGSDIIIVAPVAAPAITPPTPPTPTTPAATN